MSKILPSVGKGYFFSSASVNRNQNAGWKKTLSTTMRASKAGR